jgi:hypothetical protein
MDVKLLSCFASDGLLYWLAELLSCGALGCVVTNSEPRVAGPKVLKLVWYRLVGDLLLWIVMWVVVPVVVWMLT